MQLVSQRLEDELGDEQMMFVDGCPRDWGELSRPDAPLTVGIDGGYVHARDADNRKAGWFEVIVGKSMQENVPTKRFGFVSTYDTKPKRRLYEMLRNQGLQLNQAITFLSDGGDTVHNLQLYLSPQAEHILDWFHITMRITVMKQMAATVKTMSNSNLTKELDSVKWYLWHGNVFRALETVDGIGFDLDPEAKNNSESKLMTALEDFDTYIRNNSALIPNYSDRYHYNEIISLLSVKTCYQKLKNPPQTIDWYLLNLKNACNLVKTFYFLEKIKSIFYDFPAKRTKLTPRFGMVSWVRGYTNEIVLFFNKLPWLQ